MNTRRQVSPFVISLLLHAAVLVSLGLISTQLPQEIIPFAIETHMLDEDRPIEELTQELDQQEQAAESLAALVVGGVAANVAGGSNSAAVQQVKIDERQLVDQSELKVNVGVETIAGIEAFGNDLGPGEVTGDVGQIVDGYEAALDGITKELIRLMRQQKVLVVWLFDESESMKDDQEDIKKRFARIYEELKLAENDQEVQSSRGRGEKASDVLLTSIVSFGEGLHYHNPAKRPTSDLQQILQAIDRIPIDPSGTENTFRAIYEVVNEYRRMAVQGKRKLVIILVSDESGDDGHLVEEARTAARSVSAPVYVMGRESVFGYPYAYVNWIHPQLKSHHYLQIRRGPETPFAEQLQIDGFRRRMDAHMSGFGPYEQVRMVRDTGGIFFMLPNEEQDIHDHDRRKYDALDMRNYVPSLDARQEYEKERNASKFRATIWQAIVMLNPYDPANKDLEIPTGWLERDPAKYGPTIVSWNQRSLKTLILMTEAQRLLEEVKPLREKEASDRWRANYDLILGQLMAYRVRLFQYMIGLDQYARKVPTHKFKDAKSNRWSVGIRKGDQLLAPDEQESKLFKVTYEDIQAAHQAAIAQLELVQKRHPNTPWSKRAAWELNRGFTPTMSEHFWQPPPPRPQGPVTPVPKL